MSRPSVYDFAGGEAAFRALAAAHHQNCLDDPVLNHPFGHNANPEHVVRLASYWAEVFGGPSTFSDSYGGHSAMLRIHAGEGAGREEELNAAFLDCFVRAQDQAGLPDDPEFRATLRSYMEWALAEVSSYSPADSTVDDNLAIPRWSWDGLQA
jgi:hemoglobin